MDSVPVAPRQPSVHEDVLSVAAQCYTDPVKICYISFERDVSPLVWKKTDRDIVFHFNLYWLNDLWVYYGTFSESCVT